MNTSQLKKAIRQDSLSNQVFRGIFPIDQLPDQPSPGFYIINLDRSDQPGSHWVCTKITLNHQKNEFFDSYGFPPQKSLMKKFVGQRFGFNKKRLQHRFSTACGQWCLFYIYFSCRGFPMHEIFKKFSNQGKYTNDVAMNNFVTKKLKVRSQIIDKKFLSEQIGRSLLRNLKCCDYYYLCRRCT